MSKKVRSTPRFARSWADRKTIIATINPVAHERAKRGVDRIYGCDDCLAVCPWNKFAQVSKDANYWARIELRCPKLEHLVALNDADFREVFAGSPIKRIGRNNFIRNVLYAIGNSGDASLAVAARPLASDPDETVKDAATWALERVL